MLFVVGTLRCGMSAEMCFEKLVHGKRIIWTQRALSDSARHLNRDYVCNETFSDIESTWLPCDWRRYTVIDKPDLVVQGGAMWGDVADESS